MSCHPERRRAAFARRSRRICRSMALEGSPSLWMTILLRDCYLDQAMHTAQSGIFALGTPSHAYFEFDLVAGRNGQELVDKITSFREPRTTMGGVNLVVGFRPELWREVA